MLRGRGGCYKHTFYGIESHRCMEATPSLACANKCVFCWRHHTNPVGTSWKWQMDEPEKIVTDAVVRPIYRPQYETLGFTPFLILGLPRSNDQTVQRYDISVIRESHLLTSFHS